VDPSGRLTVLDEDQLQEAEEAGWVTAAQAERARAEVESIVRGHAAGSWPPSIVEEWTLDRARQSSSGSTQAAQSRPRSR
jgi:predicted RNA-binding protein associated with RNAse of E/G family